MLWEKLRSWAKRRALTRRRDLTKPIVPSYCYLQLKSQESLSHGLAMTYAKDINIASLVLLSLRGQMAELIDLVQIRTQVPPRGVL